VHGLEDEFLQVRMAAVDSICEIGIRQQQFAEQSVEFLVDMLQDEIDHVRVNSLHSLRKIASRVIITQEQLMTVLALLEDKTFITRSAVHRLLSNIRLCNIACVQVACTSLLLSLTQYPADRLSVYSALGQMGGNHPQFCALLVDQLLFLDRRFAPPEPVVEDVYHAGVMILLANAAARQPSVSALLPDYAARHIAYLREEYSSCFSRAEQEPSSFSAVPSTPVAPKVTTHPAESGTMVSAISATTQYVASMIADLANQINRFVELGQVDRAQHLLAEKTRSFQQQEIVSRGNSLAYLHFFILYFEVYSLLLKSDGGDESSTASDGCIPRYKKIIDSLYALQYRFVGLSSDALLHLTKLRIVASLQRLQHRSAVSSHGPENSPRSDSAELLARFETAARYARDCQSEDYEVLQQACNQLRMVFHQPHDATLELGSFEKFLECPPFFVLPRGLKESTGVLDRRMMCPRGSITISPSWPLELDVHAHVENIVDPTTIHIQVHLPNQNVLVFKTRRERWTREAPQRYRLVTKIQLAHHTLPTSPEGGTIRVSLVRQFPSDLSTTSTADQPQTTRLDLEPEFVRISAHTSLRLGMR